MFRRRTRPRLPSTLIGPFDGAGLHLAVHVVQRDRPVRRAQRERAREPRDADRTVRRFGVDRRAVGCGHDQLHAPAADVVAVAAVRRSRGRGCRVTSSRTLSAAACASAWVRRTGADAGRNAVGAAGPALDPDAAVRCPGGCRACRPSPGRVRVLLGAADLVVAEHHVDAGSSRRLRDRRDGSGRGVAAKARASAPASAAVRNIWTPPSNQTWTEVTSFALARRRRKRLRGLALLSRRASPGRSAAARGSAGRCLRGSRRPRAARSIAGMTLSRKYLACFSASPSLRARAAPAARSTRCLPSSVSRQISSSARRVSFARRAGGLDRRDGVGELLLVLVGRRQDVAVRHQDHQLRLDVDGLVVLLDARPRSRAWSSRSFRTPYFSNALTTSGLIASRVGVDRRAMVQQAALAPLPSATRRSSRCR